MFSIPALATTYTQLVDTLLASGPDLQADLEDLTSIRDAAIRIRDRTVKRFGLAGPSGPNDDDLFALEQHPDVQEANRKLGKALGHGAGVKGPFADILMQLVSLIATNPALLQLILSLFKKPA